MTIDELKEEFLKLYDAPRFRFNTPIYKQVHDNITSFIYENHLEHTEEWRCISDNLLYKSSQFMTTSEADIIMQNLELLKRTRMYKGYQQYEVAEGIGLTRQTYNYKENGKSSFNIDEIIGIVLFLELNFTEVNEIFFNNSISN